MTQIADIARPVYISEYFRCAKPFHIAQSAAKENAAIIHVRPMTLSYTVRVARPTGPNAPRGPDNRSNENAQPKTWRTSLIAHAVTIHTCEDAHWAMVGGTPSRSATPTSTCESSE